MFKVRVIPCLDVKDGRVVKGVNFVDLRDAVGVEPVPGVEGLRPRVRHEDLRRGLLDDGGGDAAQVAESLQGVLGEGNAAGTTRIAADARSNTVIVRGTPSAVAEARRIAQAFAGDAVEAVAGGAGDQCGGAHGRLQ